MPWHARSDEEGGPAARRPDLMTRIGAHLSADLVDMSAEEQRVALRALGI